jgi:glyoxylase-like metal-dependent hydrolase (beta-lactamase superfamily II)
MDSRVLDGDRRRILRLAVCVAASCVLFAGRSRAQEEGPVEKINAEAATAFISVTRLRDGLSVLMGSGGNITVLDGKDGKLLVDAGIAVSRKRIAEALQSTGSEPVKYLIDTHYHWDHTDGNAWVHALGAVIIAHENTKKRVSVATRVDDWKFTFPVYGPDAQPTQFTGARKDIVFDGTNIQIRYYGPAHTDSDVWVYFEGPNVLSTGDTFWNGVYPFIDNENGGSIDGMIRAANNNIALANAQTIVVPGHGPVGNWAQLVEFRDMLVAIRHNVAGLKGRGMSRDQVVGAHPTAKFDAKWGGFVIDPAFFTRLVYDGL